MITRTEAQAVVEKMIGRYGREGGYSAVVQPDLTIEKPWGWVFFYQSREYLETGDLSSQVAGNSPIFVNRESGETWVSGTAYPVEKYVEEYEDEIGYSPDAV